MCYFILNELNFVRRAVNSGAEWASGGGGALEGRQYELVVRHVALRSARFRQLVREEVSFM